MLQAFFARCALLTGILCACAVSASEATDERRQVMLQGASAEQLRRATSLEEAVENPLPGTDYGV